MTKESTKIKDLPDNKEEEVSSKLIKEFNKKQEEEDVESLESEDEADEQEQTEDKPLKKSNQNVKSSSFCNNITNILKDAVLVFVIFFIISNPVIVKNMSSLPYISNFEPHSVMFNFVLSLVMAVLFAIFKYSIDYFM